jgi:hypothetical protein
MAVVQAKNGRKPEKTGVNKYSIARAQPAEMEPKFSNLSGFKFSVAPMMEWTDRAEKQSVIST